MYDISTNSIEPIKRQEKELHIFDDYSEEVSEERQMEESVIETSGDTSGSNTVYLIIPNHVIVFCKVLSPISILEYTYTFLQRLRKPTLDKKTKYCYFLWKH